MAIQHRRGSYSDFDPTKMTPAEVAVVTENDPIASDGKAVYVAFAPGIVKQLATHEELQGYDEDARIAAAAAEAARNDAQAAYTNAYNSANASAGSASESANSAAAAAGSADDAEATLEAAEAAIAATQAAAESAISDAKDAAIEDINDAKDAAIADIGTAKTGAINDVDDTKDDAMDDINARAAQIVAITTTAEDIASQALATANNAENHMASLDSQMQALQTAVQNVSIDPDDLGLYQDEDTKYVYPTYKGVVSENGIPLASSGGGSGGGGEVISAVLTVTNTTGWLSKTIPTGADCAVTFTWSSVEDGMPTGDGNVRISVNDVVKATYQIEQGNVSINLAPYLGNGTNKIKVRISDTYDQGKTTTFNITCIALSLSSSFDTSTPYSNTITFPFTPVGAVEKTVHFIVDGNQIGTLTTSVSNRQMSYTIPAQVHGAHSLRVYFEAEINEETVRSNELYYEFIFIDPLSETPIITSNFNISSVSQYSIVSIPYQVYDPVRLETEVKVYVNNVLVDTYPSVPRTEQSYSYRANTTGNASIRFESGGTTKTLSFTVTESEIDVEAETEDLALYLTAEGRSNREAHPEVWEDEDNNISATLTHFNFTSDGWQSDEQGATCLRVSGAARVTIPYEIFGTDFRSTGKTIEVELATRSVLDYESTILSCMSGGRGIEITPQTALLKSEQSVISMQYKEDEHIRISFVAEKRSEDRLLIAYIDAIPSGVIQYPANDDFSQITPVGISIGSDDCTIDIYCIRVYDNNLTRQQILDNWIADTQDGALMLERYTRNTVYDAYGKITAANLPDYLPYFVFNAEELPQYKGDKKIVSGSYTDRRYPSRSFTFTGCQMNVQGTTSARYEVKNYDLQFLEGIDSSSGHSSAYTLRPGAIPFNRFVLKADVASSEGANNVELVRLYNDACPYKTQEMTADSRVRWGIDGFPIAVFWHNTVTGDVSFIGKFNFNLPKRAPGPYGYDPESPDIKIKNMESWEFQQNRSGLMLFQTDVFDETIRTDPDTGEEKEAWRFDYEARFPSDKWTNYSILQELQSFVYSTWRDEATGDALAEPVTYEGTTYTTDSAAYRLAKFRAEFPSYAELDSFLFYYIFTELFLLMDSRAKNLFIGFNGSDTAAGHVAPRKATAQPYDMDSAMGTNNEGTLTYGYSLEDRDGDIFTGHGSVLWENIRDAYPTEIQQMYKRLRSSGALTYTAKNGQGVEDRFEEHQSKWPEAVWIEDAWIKYLNPLISPSGEKQPTSMYLSMLQGSKEQQRKWWLSNRFRYMDSKWHAGDAITDPIYLRAYAKGNITVTPYFDIYPSVRYASYTVSERGEHGQPTTLICPGEIATFYDTEIYIYSAPQIAAIGDLSPLQLGLADLSSAVHLQEIKIGDSDSNYDNPNLYELDFGANVLLKVIDVRNCSGFGDTSQQGHSQTTVDLSGCAVVEEIYFEGTKATGITLPNGGNIKKLHLPDTTTNLEILNQNKITDFVLNDLSNLTTVRIENSSIDAKSMLMELTAGTRVRLIGFVWEAEDAEEILSILSKLDTMRGLNESGGNMDDAQVSGTIHTDTLSAEDNEAIAEAKAKFPYITILADNSEATLTYKTWDGGSVLKTVTCINGVPQDTAPSNPSRTSTAQYSYTFVGWATRTDAQAAEEGAISNVLTNRTVYAAYSRTVRTYTVTFVKASDDGGGTLQTLSNKAYGTQIKASDYTGSTPTTSKGSATDYPFLGWSPSLPYTITDNQTFTAVFGSPVEVAEITDSWDTIISKIDAGTYKTAYKIGNYKPLDLGTEGTINMQIVAFDTDIDKNGNVVPITFLAKELLATPIKPNNTETTRNGWIATSNLYPYLQNTVYNLIPSVVANRIVAVQKTFLSYDGYSTIYDASTEKIWIPSVEEMFTPEEYTYGYKERSGRTYNLIYKDNSSRIKSNLSYWLRSVYSYSDYFTVGENGGINHFNARGDNGSYGNGGRWLQIGFCLGYEPETITNDWATILSNADYATDYSIGDTKEITINGERHLMEIVAFDADSKTGGGTANISWLMKDLMNDQRVMGNMLWTSTSSSSYLNSWLTETVLPSIDSTIRSHIVDVDKTFYYKIQNKTISDSVKLWPPSIREIFGTTPETSGVNYSSKFIDAASRIKKRKGTAESYWTRTNDNAINGFYMLVSSTGENNAVIQYDSSRSVCIGFCTDVTPSS